MIAHVDKTVVEKINKGEVDIDLCKLLVKPKKSSDHSLQMVNKDGYSFLVPPSEKELPAITSFKKWEQAFRVFSRFFFSSYQVLKIHIRNCVTLNPKQYTI